MRASARTARPSRSRGWVAAVLAGALLTGACGRIVTLELPELDAVPRTPPVQSLVYDAEGNRLAVLRREHREPVALDTLADHVIDAVVTAEDQRFFVHGGVDARAVARAALANAVSGEIEEGGSTITQQLVKSLYMPDAPRTPETKLEEALLARQVESQLSKEEILEQYLNTVYFGGGAYGIQAAARTYWRIPAAELDLRQAALLAVIIRAPRSLDPTEHPDAARAERDELLGRMADHGHISGAQARAAAAGPVAVEPRPRPPRTREPHWVDFVVRTLLDDPSFGDTEAERVQRLYGGGLRIHTTLDPEIQRAARDVLSDALPNVDDPDAAIVAVEPTSGHVLAAAGNRAYEQLQFDLPTQAHRQPGSTFKAFVLATAVADGRGPDALLDGSQRPVDTGAGSWDLDNFDGASYGRVTLAGATRASINTAFARLALDVGVPRVAGLARAMGITSPVPDDPMIAVGAGSLAVSPLEMASGFATLAHLGRHVPPTPVTRIETAEGEVVWRAEDLARPVLEPSAAFVTTQMLRDVVEAGTGLGARVPGWEVAGKTGTTDDHADAWFVGYTTTLAASLWVGHHEGRVPLRVDGIARPTGGSLAAPLWAQFMERALSGTQPRDFRLPPEAYEVVEIDPETGLLATDWCPGEETPVPRVLVPHETCPSPPPRPAPQPRRTPTATPSPSPTATPSPAPVSPTPSPGGPSGDQSPPSSPDEGPTSPPST